MKHTFTAVAASLSILGSASAWSIPTWSGGYLGWAQGSSDDFTKEAEAIASAYAAAEGGAAATTSAAPAAATGHESGGKEYMVIFNSSHPTTPEVEEILNRLELSSNHSDVVQTFDNAAFKGFVANMKDHCVNALGDMVEVDKVEETASMSAYGVTTRGDAPWGLQRISSSVAVSGEAKDGLTFTYSFEDSSLGKGVDIYVVDTGVQVEHIAFQGRARHGWSAFPLVNNQVKGWEYPEGNHTDGAGHGTHVAGTSAGATLGIASGANIIAVRVLDENGGGSSVATAKGIEWVINQHQARRNQSDFVGSILSMSFGTDSVSESLNDVIVAATTVGIHASVAAGNQGKDACDFTPSSAGGANSSVVSVGAIAIDDEIASFSNTGACTDIFAPGEDILSTYIGASNNVVEYLDGTSMACPHVTGVMAYLMEKEPALRLDPAAMKVRLTGSALTNIVDGIVLDSASKVLLNNGVTSSLLGKRRASPDQGSLSDSLVIGSGEGKKKTSW